MRSNASIERRHRLRRLLLLQLVIVTLVSAVSISCKTPVEAQVETSDIIREMAPEIPELPSWPQLTWIYKDGLYCLSEEDADKILDYWENKIPAYLLEMDVYKAKLKTVLEHL